jgi:hypothetical protein
MVGDRLDIENLRGQRQRRLGMEAGDIAVMFYRSAASGVGIRSENGTCSESSAGRTVNRYGLTHSPKSTTSPVLGTDVRYY